MSTICTPAVAVIVKSNGFSSGSLLAIWSVALRVPDTDGLKVTLKVTVAASVEATLLDYQDVGVLLLLMESGCRITEVDIPMAPRRRNCVGKIVSSTR